MPTTNGFFSANHTLTAGQQTDPTGSTCADATGNAVDCSTPREPSTSAGSRTASRARAARAARTRTAARSSTRSSTGNLPLSVFNQSLARILYEEERFGMLGCDPTPVRRRARTPAASAPTAPAPRRCRSAATASSGRSTATRRSSRSTRRRARRCSRTTATRCRSRPSDLAGGILVTGSSANHTVADPTNEASTGFIDRDAVNPLQQLKYLSGNPSAFTFVPANDPTGQPVPCTVTNDSSPTGPSPAAAPPATCGATSGLAARVGRDRRDARQRPGRREGRRHDRSAAGQLAGGKAYRWSGWVVRPRPPTPTRWAARRTARPSPNANVHASPSTTTRARRPERPVDAHAGQRADHLRRDRAGQRRRTPATPRRC